MANNSEEGQGSQRAVLPVMMIMMRYQTLGKQGTTTIRKKVKLKKKVKLSP
jgi:hypothetical protein